MAIAQIKGSTFRLRLQFIRTNYGDAAIDRVLRRLPQEEAAVVRSALPIGWYPLSLNARLDEAICAELAGGDERLFEQLGEYSATSFARDIYTTYFEDRRPERFIQASCDLYHHYYRNAGSRLNEIQPGEALVMVIGSPEAYRPNCMSNVGFMRGALGLLGARSLQVVELQCAAAGGADCRTRITWTP